MESSVKFLVATNPLIKQKDVWFDFLNVWFLLYQARTTIKLNEIDESIDEANIWKKHSSIIHQ